MQPSVADRPPVSCKRVVPLALALSAACGDRPPEPSNAIVTGEDWLSESAYRFGDVMAGDALFGRIYVRVTADNRRVFVLEPFQSRVSIWAPDGRRLVDLGSSGEGPGDFFHPHRVDLDESGFYIRDQQRISYFSYDGSLLRTVPNPPTSVSYQGFPIRLYVLLDDGSFLGKPDIPATIRLGIGLFGDDPIDTMSVLRVRKSGRDWVQEEVLRYSIRNATQVVSAGGHRFAGQTYSDADRYRLDREAGSVVLGRRVGRSFMLSASSGQVWLQSQERVDTLRVWYAMERGDTVTPPRRVLLPESLEVHDATATHVWGAWKDELGVNYVVGRKLVPPS